MNSTVEINAIEMTPEQLAQACADSMLARDVATRHLNMRVEQVAPGRAILTMPVIETMVQGHGTCHGGYLFTFADSAFAFACNTYNKMTVASGCSIDYIRPALLGDNLTATAEEVSRGKRTGVCDVRITNQDNKLVALFRGKSYQVDASVL